MPKVKGAKTARARFRKLPKEMFDEVTKVIFEDGVELLGRSQALIPELERTLILTGDVEKKVSGQRVRVVVSYGTPYAVIRHEDEYELGPVSSLKSGTQDGPVGRKYLERPFQNMKRRITGRDVPGAIIRGARRVKRIR